MGTSGPSVGPKHGSNDTLTAELIISNGDKLLIIHQDESADRNTCTRLRARPGRCGTEFFGLRARVHALLCFSSHLRSALCLSFYIHHKGAWRSARARRGASPSNRTSGLGGNDSIPSASLQGPGCCSASPSADIIPSTRLGAPGERPCNTCSSLLKRRTNAAMLPPQTARFTSFPQRERCVVMAMKISEVRGGFFGGGDKQWQPCIFFLILSGVSTTERGGGVGVQ